MSKLGKFMKRLAGSSSGVAMTEFPLAMPFFLTAGLWGVELANFSIVNLKVNQLAMHLADNSSRIGDTSMLENRKIYEADINDLLLGANLQGGRSLNLYDNGRVIISSLEVVPGTTDRQYIKWQRCMGRRTVISSYGVAGDGADGSLAGMGPAGEEVISFDGEAVMFVEISYEYQPIVSTMLASNSVVSSIASFTVRGDRDLAQIYQRDPSSPDPVADCDSFTNTVSSTI